MDSLTLVVGALVALQTLQTVQVSILRRDVRASLRPPPPPMPPRCLICGLFHDPPPCDPRVRQQIERINRESGR